jgi:hypothetical protein
MGRNRVPVDSQNYQAQQEGEGAPPVRRDGEGRWRKGVSGNPAGRPRGARNQATRMAEALLDAASAMLTNKAIEAAMDGDAVALRFCLARSLAPRRFAPLDLALPPFDTQQDLSLAMAAVGKATAEGEIGSEQALHLACLIDAARHAIQARDAEFRENHFWGRQRSPAAPPHGPPHGPPDGPPGPIPTTRPSGPTRRRNELPAMAAKQPGFATGTLA